jgi:hypothetical protein
MTFPNHLQKLLPREDREGSKGRQIRPFLSFAPRRA